MPDQPSPALTCPSCGAAHGPADQFCESCGRDLAQPTVVSSTSIDPAAPTAQPDEVRTHIIEPGGTRYRANQLTAEPVVARTCGECGGLLDDDRWCTECGLRAPSERDHWSEEPSVWVGAVCDRGLRHARNEDAMATAAEQQPATFCALVVCDGVTTAVDSDQASLAASRAALTALLSARTAAGAPNGSATDSPAARIMQWTQRLEDASTAANDAASEVAAHVAPGLEPPSCTFVAAVLDGPLVTVGWVGDSRAYWLADEGPAVQLSVDDSWATEQMALGMPRERAEADELAHSITRWLGADSHDALARCASITVDGPGWLLVCSDGLWNYCSPADDMRRQVHATAAERGLAPVDVAQGLVDFANASGGHDNITVALARVAAASD